MFKLALFAIPSSVYPNFEFLLSGFCGMVNVPQPSPYKNLVSSLNSASFSESETQKLLEIISKKAGKDSWQLVKKIYISSTPLQTPNTCLFLLALISLSFLFAGISEGWPIGGTEEAAGGEGKAADCWAGQHSCSQDPCQRAYQGDTCQRAN